MHKITPGIKKLLEMNVVGFSTVDKHNKPHSIAVAYVKVCDNKIIISNTHIKESLKNLKTNNNVSLVVWNREWKKACIGFELRGIAENFKIGKWYNFVNNIPENEGYKIKSAIVIRVSKIKKLIV